MRKQNEQQIERGRALHRLKTNPDFAILLREWDERIELLIAARDSWDESPLFDSHSLTRIVHRLSSLKSLRDWIDDEIAIGGKEKMRQESNLAAIRKPDPQEVKSTDPMGQSEE